MNAPWWYVLFVLAMFVVGVSFAAYILLSEGDSDGHH